MIINILIICLAVIMGFVISYYTKEEIVEGRVWFKILLVISVILGGIFYYKDINYLWMTFLFIFIITGISLIRSYYIRKNG